MPYLDGLDPASHKSVVGGRKESQAFELPVLLVYICGSGYNLPTEQIDQQETAIGFVVFLIFLVIAQSVEKKPVVVVGNTHVYNPHNILQLQGSQVSLG